MISESKKRNFIRIPDRKKAIAEALRMAQAGDTVLVAGKGRDNYMALGEEYIPYSDYETIESYFHNCRE